MTNTAIPNRKRGKRTEAALATRTGSKRVGIFGDHDLEHELWSIEVKNRQKCVVTSWMHQSIRNCHLFKTPLVILHIHGDRHDNDLVMMRLKDWEDNYGKLGSDKKSESK